MEMGKANNVVVVVTFLLVGILVFILGVRFKNMFTSDKGQLLDDSNAVSYPTSYVSPTKSEAEKILDSMSLKQKVAQMFVFAFLTADLLPEEQSYLEEYKPGGVVFLGENVVDEVQVRNLTQKIDATNTILKPFTLVDQEGGVVARINWDNYGSPKEIAYLSESEICSRYSFRSQLLNTLGLNWNLGIVADVTVDSTSFIYDRTFSEDYNIASTVVAIATKCTQSNLNTVKHYPGHGATNLDTHESLAVITKSEEEWKKSDLLPFTAAINNNIDSVMVGHLILNWLDSENPASLSKSNIDYIRNLGFSGLIVTDDLRMLDASGFDRNDALKRAILAGNDILLYSTYDYAEKKGLIDFAVSEIENGLISESELNNRVLKIIEKKLTL